MLKELPLIKICGQRFATTAELFSYSGMKSYDDFIATLTRIASGTSDFARLSFFKRTKGELLTTKRGVVYFMLSIDSEEAQEWRDINAPDYIDYMRNNLDDSFFIQKPYDKGSIEATKTAYIEMLISQEEIEANDG